MSLSTKVIEKITLPGRYHDKNGLHLRVTPNGTKSWILRYQHEGTRHDAGLGGYPKVSLSEARKAAMEFKVKLHSGVDPLAERKKQTSTNPATITFENEALEFIERHRPGWSEKHSSQWLNSMRDHVFQLIGLRPVAEIGTDDVLKVLDPIWNSKPETARRVRNRIERVLDYSKARGYRDGDNPARWRGHLQNIMARRHDNKSPLESMPYHQLPQFMKVLDGIGTRQAYCLQFLILTAARTSEAMGAKWDEIDFANRVWNIPAERMKNSEPHQVPLSDAAMEVLKDVGTRGRSDYIFPNRRLSALMANNSLRRLLSTLGHDCTVHGFRATFRTWADEKTNFPFELCEIALSHVVGNLTSRSYARGNQLEKRRALMDRWARFAMDRVHPELRSRSSSSHTNAKSVGAMAVPFG